MILAKNKNESRWLRSIKVSETGLVRPENQDRLFAGFFSGVYCVADGMGGGAEGEKASTLVCNEVYRAVSRSSADFASRMEAVEEGLQAANAIIYNYAQTRNYRQMGSTAAILVFDTPGSGRGAVCHVGDSRIYRVRDGLATLLTRDHTVISELGLMMLPESYGDKNVRSHPLAHILTRAIGTDRRVNTEWRKIDVQKGDRFIICSDGVHDVVSDALIGFLAGYGSLDLVKQRLVSAIVNGGAPDNYSFIIIDVGEP
jgi:serine/threonine protein phosphatase PrpC